MPVLPSSSVKPVTPLPSQPWLVKHGRAVLVALAAGGAAALLIVAVVTNLGKARARAWEQLSMAQAQSAQGQKEEALKTLDGLLASQRTGSVAVQSLMTRSEILIALKKDGALAAAEGALRQADRPEYKALALANLAYVLEETGDRRGAAARYTQFIQDHPDHFLTARAYVQLGRLQAAEGLWSDAQATFEKLMTLYPSSLWARDAKTALEDVKAHLPAPAPRKP
jgi:TolA-binding protein